MTAVESGGPIRYARTGGVSLAYQVFGSGPVEVVTVPPMAQNIELMWERPEYRRVLTRVASFARLVHFDKRGTGLSDRTQPVPTLDERVEDLRAVMDAAGIERPFLHGISEGGPMALLFAATYPDRVAGLVLHATSSLLMRPRTETDAEREERWRAYDFWLERWGTDESITLAVLAPTAHADPSYRAWHPRYERNSATPAALRDLIALYENVDVDVLLPRIRVPTLVLHRRDDPVIPLAEAEHLAAHIPGARLVVLEGGDHMAHVGDVHAWLDELERFVTGVEPPPRMRPTDQASTVEVRTLGGFAVVRDGVETPLSEWGSRRARLLCQRLAVAPPNEPVPRDQLVDLLWPGEADPARLGARLSVQLSTVRRVLGGGVIADRDAVRLDRQAVQVDLDALHAAAARSDHAEVVGTYRGEVLPEAAYEPWAEPAREWARTTYVRALRALADGEGDGERRAELALRLLAVDPYDRDAHLLLVRARHDLGQFGEARRAHARYMERMGELGVDAEPFDASIDG